mgnify:FL=1
MEEYWDRFKATGKIEDYLYYKKMEAGKKDLRPGRNTIGKSDHTDWHDTGSSTYRGI